MRELDIFPDVRKDPNATEMIRFFLANDEPHVSLLLGMYEDAEDCNVDELWAWGHILSDIVQHIANGFEQSHGWKYDETVTELMKNVNEVVAERNPGLEGSF